MKVFITPEMLQELLSYNPKTGVITWKPRDRKWFTRDMSCNTWNTRYANKKASPKINRLGYASIRILGQSFQGHRVAWAIANNEWPDGQIDHINGDRADNRLANLRVVTPEENNKNSKMPKHNTSGVLGVHKHSKTGRWVAQIRHKRRHIHIGYFADMDSAVAARKAAEEKYGYHRNHGRSPATPTKDTP